MANIIDDLNYRGLIEQYSNEENLRKLLGKKQTIYCGFDPSASSMHLGNYVMISILKRLQLAGHRIIAVVGGATGMIGDPSGKSKERNLQTKETLAANTNAIRQQLERFIDLSDPDKGLILNNYDWLGQMSTLDFLRDYGKYFPINYMLSKEIVASRLEEGISFTEFAYQILQSIDFHTLRNRYNCLIQIGGNDQWGNLTSGLELIRKLDGDKAEAECMTAHLITNSEGKKFGKSEKGAMFLDRKLTSPYTIYQYFINCSDEDAIKYLKVFSFLSHEEIEEEAKEHFENPGARLGQKKVAFEVVKDIHGLEAAKEALKMSEVLFSGEVQSLNAEEIEELLGSLKVKLEGQMNILDLLVKLGAASSKTQAKTFVIQHSVSVNGHRVDDIDRIIGKEDTIATKYVVLRRGKKNYYLGEF